MDQQYSAALLAANAQLYVLRNRRQKERPSTGVWPQKVNAVSQESATTPLVTLPAHLGWESVAVTAVLRRQADPQNAAKETAVPPPASTATPQPAAENHQPQHKDWVKLYPDIGLGMLRQEKTAPGRLWLMLRLLDQDGQGAMPLETINQRLTHPTANLRLCGKRQLRNLLKAGEGIFWTRDREYLWLRSAARVAAALGVRRLTGKPVALPLAALLGGIGDFRAHLYAAFHSGRAKETPRGQRMPPVARKTLTRLSGVGASSQRSYEARVGLYPLPNYAIGEQFMAAVAEKRAWQQGQALFKLKDYRGQQGRAGSTYLAWQLPNSYASKHPRRPKGRQKRINQALKDLVIKGTPGNVAEQIEAQPAGREKRYYALAKEAVQQSGRSSRPVYWRQTAHGRCALWQVLEGR
ncbi:MAG: hypothetical protein KC415_01435 [Anaerolineales bacterium]|nr:hypothetical protein [Anaerolineales bacterium]